MTMNLFHKACREAANLEGAPHLSLNVSPLMLHDDQLAQKLLRIMEEHSFAPQRLEIELTEAALVTDIAAARAILMALREHGVRIALDNFGTGHASLTQLRLLPFDKLKIDRSFVRRITTDTEAAALVRAAIAMARSLGLVVVAEGVENADQARMLAGMGCDMAQGFHFGRAKASVEQRAVKIDPAVEAPAEVAVG